MRKQQAFRPGTSGATAEKGRAAAQGFDLSILRPFCRSQLHEAVAQLDGSQFFVRFRQSHQVLSPTQGMDAYACLTHPVAPFLSFSENFLWSRSAWSKCPAISSAFHLFMYLECLDHRIERSECNPIGQVVLKIVDVLPTRREQGELRAKPRKTTIQ